MAVVVAERRAVVVAERRAWPSGGRWVREARAVGAGGPNGGRRKPSGGCAPREGSTPAVVLEVPDGYPSMRCVLQNDVRSVDVAACAAALNSAVVETPYQCACA